MAQIPNVQIPGYITQTALAAVQAAIDDAARLGLTWRLRPGTVGGTGVANPVRVPVVVDGDDATTKASSMVGALAAGQRVWCAQIPPAGLYIIGIIGPSVLAPTVTTFTASGTWTRPTGLAWARITLAGGGGAGGGAEATGVGEGSMGAGGGGGATGVLTLAGTDLPPTVTVTPGAGGAGVSGAAGNAGGTSSFGAFSSAGGGGGGTVRANSAVPHGAAPGAGSNTVAGTGVILRSGSAGESAWGNGQLGFSGSGGASHLGGGGAGQRTGSGGQAFTGNVGLLYGGGGAGAIVSASSPARTGGSGAAGIVIVEEYYQ